MLTLDLINFWGVKLGVFHDSELIASMYFPIRPLPGGKLATPTFPAHCSTHCSTPMPPLHGWTQYTAFNIRYVSIINIFEMNHFTMQVFRDSDLIASIYFSLQPLCSGEKTATPTLAFTHKFALITNSYIILIHHMKCFSSQCLSLLQLHHE